MRELENTVNIKCRFNLSHRQKCKGRIIQASERMRDEYLGLGLIEEKEQYSAKMKLSSLLSLEKCIPVSKPIFSLNLQINISFTL